MLDVVQDVSSLQHVRSSQLKALEAQLREEDDNRMASRGEATQLRTVYNSGCMGSGRGCLCRILVKWSDFADGVLGRRCNLVTACSD